MHNTVRDSSAPSLMTHCRMSIAPLKYIYLKTFMTCSIFVLPAIEKKTRLSLPWQILDKWICQSWASGGFGVRCNDFESVTFTCSWIYILFVAAVSMCMCVHTCAYFLEWVSLQVLYLWQVTTWAKQPADTFTHHYILWFNSTSMDCS